MKALVLAGGFGIRLREVLHGRPKVLAVVDCKPFLEHILIYLREQGIVDVVLAVGYLARQVREQFGDGSLLGMTIRYSEEARPLGTAGAIRNAARLLDQDFIVLNGDTLLQVDIGDLCRFHRARRADVTMVATPAYHERGGLITVGPKGQVLHFAEHRQPSESGHINAGLYIFRPRVLSVLRPNERSFLERDLFPLLLRRRYRLFAYVMAGDYFDIGSREGYEQAQRALPRTEGNGG